MKKIFTIITLTFILLAGFVTAKAQTSVLDPNDSVYTYNPIAPPTQPAWGTIGKWVRTNDFSWSVPYFKAYIYKGMAFRLMFPKSYNPNANDGKVYPMVMFLHGDGEAGTIYDNELSLRWEGGNLRNAVNNGVFDGFVLFPQNTTGYFPAPDLQALHELIQYMIQNDKLDANRVSISGLSAGGQGDWNYLTTYPNDIASADIISAAFSSLLNNVNTLKYIPIWLAQGGIDNDPTPYTSQSLVNALNAAGAPITYTVYAGQGHGVWDLQYAQPDTYPFFLRANKTNPVVFFGQTQFCPSDTGHINVTLGLQPGFDGYEWRKDSVVIAGATGNTLVVTKLGSYDARIKRGSTWSYWSPMPVVISVKQPTQTPNIQVAGLASTVIPAPDGSTSVQLTLPAGYASYAWQKVGSDSILSTQQAFTASQSGNYVAEVTETGGCSSNPSIPFYVASASGPNPPNAAFSLTGFASSQTQNTLQWSNNPSPLHNETAFEIYRSATSGGPYKLVAINPADSLTYIDNGLLADTKYYYIVRAIDSTAAAAPSNEFGVITLVDKIPPTAPGNLTITGTSQNSVSLQWNAAIDNVSVSNYYIYINGSRSYVTTDTTFTIHNLTHGQVYTIVVKAVDPTGNLSPASSQVIAAAIINGLTWKYYTSAATLNTLPDFNSITPDATGTAANVNLNMATQPSNYSVMWQGYITIPIAGSYTFATTSDDGSALYFNTPYSATATPTVNNNYLQGATNRVSAPISLQPGVYPITITYFQQAGGTAMQVFWQTPKRSGSTQLNAQVAIPDSAFKESFTMPGSAPAAPSNIKATAASYNQINLTWKDNSSNEKGFEIYRASSLSGPFNIITTTGANTTSYSDTTLNPQTTYFYEVQAINQYGSSGFNPADLGGLQYSYYTGSWSTLPNFNTLTPVSTGNTSNVSLSPATATTNYAFTWTGTIRITTPGSYVFGTNSDDGSALYYNTAYSPTLSKATVNNDGAHGTTYKASSTIKNVKAGTYPITITYFQQGGGAVMEAYWQTPTKSGGTTLNAKTLIPDSVFADPNMSATTLALPAAPAAPTNLTATAASPYKINLSWSDNSSIETGFTIYRSVGNNTNYVTLANIGSNTGNKAMYSDSGLVANTNYYYKVLATGIGGNSDYSNEISTTTTDNPPVLGNISNFTVRYDTTLEINVSASDPDNEKLTLSISNLPSFGTFTDYGDGTGLITFNPTQGNQGTYQNILVTVSDQHSGTATKSFSLVVNSSYQLSINPIPTISLNPSTTVTDTLTASDGNPGDNLTWSADGLPSFATLTTLSDGKAVLAFSPAYGDAGNYSAQINVSNGNGGNDSKSVVINVAYINPVINWYLNFSYQTKAGLPWNNITGVTTQNLVNDQGTTTSVGLAMQTTWWGAYNAGAVTGNNSGIYSDNVMKDYYYFGFNGGPNTVTTKVTGLDPGTAYNITFFASSVYSGTPDNGYTVFTIGAKSDSIHVQNNTQTTITFNNIVPAADSTITFVMRKGINALGGEINAMVISTNADKGSVPGAPKNFAVTNLSGGAVKLNWSNPAYNNAQGHEVYRATALTGTYTLLNPNPSNGVDSSYTDNTSAGHPVYYYTIRAINQYGNSAFTDTLSTNDSIPPPPPISAANWYLNFSYQTAAGLPWNNITSVTTHNLANDQGTTTNVGLAMQTTWWGAYNAGAVTGNNSGIYPDNVMKDYYYFGFNGGPNTITTKVTGLNPGTTYNITFFASSVYSGTPDNGYTVFTIGAKSDSIHVQNNTQTTITFNNIIPAADSTITFVMRKGVTALGGEINAMVINQNATNGTAPDKPLNFTVNNVTGGVVKLSWSNPATNNALGHEVYRATALNGAYTLLNPNPTNGGDTSYTDSTIAGKTLYYYTIRAINQAGASAYTDTLNITTAAQAPHFSTIGNVQMSFGNTDTVNINVTSAPNDTITLSATNLPGFATFQDLGKGNGRIILTPASTDVGNYSGITVTAITNNGGSASTSFNIAVRDQLTVTYVNFTEDLLQAAPWNNLIGWTAGVSLSNLVDTTNTPTGAGITLSDSWTRYNDGGPNTYGNTGIFPDNVLLSYLYTQDTSVRHIKVSGLSPNQKYNFVFYGGSVYYTYKYNTTYSIGNTSVSLNGTHNVSQTVQINGVIPDASGNVTISVQKPASADMGLLNALVIESYSDTTAIVHPSNLQAVAGTGTVINLTWSDNSDNETGFTVWRAGSATGTYSLIASVPANSISYADNSVAANTRYFYKVQATAPNNVKSAFSNMASAVSLQYAVYMNFNSKEAPAPAPWNNTNRFPSDGDSFSNLLDNNGNNTGITLSMPSNFEGENNVGTVTGNNSGIFPDLVMQGLYYLDNGLDTVVMQLSGLDLSTQYNFVFFGSVGEYINGLTTLYYINDNVVAQNSLFNTTGTVQINNILPDNNGVITIRIINAASSPYAVLNAMLIQAHSNYDSNGNLINNLARQQFTATAVMDSGKPNTMDNEIKVYPNPISDQIHVELNVKEAEGPVTLQLYDISGRLIKEKYIGNLPIGHNTTTMDVSDKKLANGSYLLKVSSANNKLPSKTIHLIKLQ